jgi:hypothetical protein
VEFEELEREQQLLRHRLIDIPDGRSRYEITGRLCHVTRLNDDGKVLDGPWSFPLSAPPSGLLHLASDDDVGLLVTQRYHLGAPGAAWLSAANLIELGQFAPMQQIRGRLVHRTSPGCFYCFVSHRWLTPTHPDPEGRRARLLAWQLVSHLCEAIRVARRRGLSTPRKFNRYLGVTVGAAGSNLAESLIVNVLRPGLNDAGLAQAYDEARSLERHTRDYGIAAADEDRSLQLLAAHVAERPLIATLLSRVMLWYDYSCIPQAPRASDDEQLFSAALQHLSSLQIIGRTAILLDDPEDYLSRAWCTVEAVTADAYGYSYDTLVGAARTAARSGEVEQHFAMLLADRPHFVWRAVLDTELFRVQTPDECMRRLGLRVTEPRDLLMLYERLAKLPAPVKMHADGSELVTGVLPVPILGRRAMVPRSGELVIGASEPTERLSFDCSSAMKLDGDIALLPPLVMGLARGAASNSRRCHVAVVAACEGEAILMSRWCLAHLAKLDTLLNVCTASLSWTASDIAPVGHVAVGELSPTGIDADVWILVSTSMQLHGSVARALVAAIEAADRQRVEIAVDQPEENVRIYLPQAGSDAAAADQRRGVEILPAERLRGVSHPGGLFRATLFERIV